MLDSVLGIFARADLQSVRIERRGLVLAAIAASGPRARFNALQIQNLLFLIDREIAADIGGPHFDFEPYPYGPYDPSVLETVERLVAEGKVVVDRTGPYWVCFATPAGFGEGLVELDRMIGPASRFVTTASGWVLAQPFWQLLAAIYRRYPEMAANSRIPLRALRDAHRPRQARMHPFLRGMAQSIGILRRSGEHVAESDGDAVAADWRAVGDDLRAAMERVLPRLGSS